MCGGNARPACRAHVCRTSSRAEQTHKAQVSDRSGWNCPVGATCLARCLPESERANGPATTTVCFFYERIKLLQRIRLKALELFMFLLFIPLDCFVGCCVTPAVLIFLVAHPLKLEECLHPTSLTFNRSADCFTQSVLKMRKTH